MYAKEYERLNDGKRVRLRPFAIIWGSRDGKGLKTATSDEAVIDLDKAIGEVSGPGDSAMHVVHAQISGDVRLRDNKGTPNILEDDLLIGPMPYVEYDEPSLQIRSDSDVVIQDRDMRITGFGLQILLRPKEEGGRVRVQRGEDRVPEEERPHRHPGRRPVGGLARQGHGPAGADGPDAARPAVPGADADRPARAEAPRPRRATRPAGPHVRQLLARRPRPPRQRRPAPRPAGQRPPAPDPPAGRETRRDRRRPAATPRRARPRPRRPSRSAREAR